MKKYWLIMTSNSNKIGLGTVQFGLDYGVSNKQGQTHINEVGKILEIARLKGVDLIDTASGYGNAENVLGQFDLSMFKVITKFMPIQELKLETLLKQSLDKLNIEKLYAYLAHRPLSLLKDDSWKELRDLKEIGFVEKIGYSLNDPFELEKLLELGYYPDIIQVPFNYFDRRFEEQIKKLKNIGCEIHTRSAFLQGLFFMQTKNMSSFFNPVKSIISELQDSYKESLSKVLLNYCLLQEGIDKVVIGVNDSNQLLENLNVKRSTEILPELMIKVPDNILNPSKWKI